MLDWVTVAAAQLESQEDFINLSFWRQVVGVLLGALLAFAGAFGVWWVSDRSAKRRIARVARNTLISELQQHLLTLDIIEALTKRTADALPSLLGAWVTPTPPNAVTLRQFISPIVLPTLSDDELIYLLNATAHLDYFNGSYGSWERTLTSEQALRTQARDPATGKLTPHWQLETADLFRDISLVRVHVLLLLVCLCKKASAPLIEPRAESIRTLLNPVRWDAKHQGPTIAARSSDLETSDAQELREFIVVWKHNWLECPRPVFELSTGTRHDPTAPPAPARADAAPQRPA